MFEAIINKNYNKKRLLKRTIFFTLVLITAILFALLIGSRICYREFYNKTKREFEIPGISTGFVPQGFEFIKSEDLFLISGYMDNDDASLIYIVNSDKSFRKITVLNADGSIFKSHSGGISTFGEYIYMAGCDGECYVLTLESVTGDKSEFATIIGSFEVYNGASFCSINDGKLYVGEYYHAIKYPTDVSHHLITPNGDKNNAIITVFELDKNMQLGVNPIPIEAHSITGRIQGMCFLDNNKITLSASSVFTGSQLYVYDYSTVLNEERSTFLLGNTTVPLYYIDGRSLLKTIEILPKSEGLTFREGRIYMLFESASNRFKFGKLIGGQYVYSYENRMFN